MKSPDFEQAFQDLMDLEGWGEAHDVEGDPGGLTVFGISRNAWPGMYEDGLPTETEAREFYREAYWNQLDMHILRAHVMAFQIFEFSVNSGDGRGAEESVLAAQRAVNKIQRLRCRPVIQVDGVMGPETRWGLNVLAPNWKYRKGWVRYFDKFQLEYYESLPESLQRRFLLGWAIQRT